MNPDVVAFAEVAVVIVGLVGSLSFIAVLLVKQVMGSRERPAAADPAHDERLEHLQQSIDAIAVEVERIAEAQRFSAKLLADRPERTSSLPS